MGASLSEIGAFLINGMAVCNLSPLAAIEFTQHLSFPGCASDALTKARWWREPEPILHLAWSQMDSGPEPAVGCRRPKPHPGMTVRGRGRS
jgi:hypothetical protein